MNLTNVYISVFQQICYYFLKHSPPAKKKHSPHSTFSDSHKVYVGPLGDNSQVL